MIHSLRLIFRALSIDLFTRVVGFQRRGIWLLVLLGHSLVTRGQLYPSPQNPDLLPPYFIPKSPTVSALPRFDSQQLVDLPTGGSRLSLPLTNVAAGPLHLPVALAYAYSGLHVYQPFDVVGLGWSLQAGASITRQVNSLVDETYAGDASRRYNPDSLLVNRNKAQYLKRVVTNDVDAGPDIYSFALPTGLSGRFVILDTAVILFPRQPVQVRRLPGATTANGHPYGSGFQVATEDGVRYQFLAAEVTTPNPNNFGAITEHVSAWHLTRIISADQADTLQLFYSNSIGSQTQPLQCSVTTGRYYTGQYEQNGNVADPQHPDQGCGSKAEYSFHNTLMSPSRVQGQFLDSITTRGTRLVIWREGVNHEIRYVRLLATSGERREVRRFTFYQTHFDGGTTTDYRLRLDSVRESANAVALPAYRFTYNAGITPPARNSAAVDYWGYANGATGNGDASTKTNPTLLADPVLAQRGQRVADRAPQFAYAQVGALRTVRYPTGGTSHWDYEPTLMNNAGADIPIDTLLVDTGPLGYDPNKAVVQDNKSLTIGALVPFQVPLTGQIRVYLARQPVNNVSGGGGNTYRDFDIWRRLPSGDTLITKGVVGYKSPDPGSGKNFYFNLPAGLYVTRLYCESRETNSDLTVYIPYRDSTSFKIGIPGPGIRVAQTTTLAPGAPPLVRSYDYAVSGTSTGISLLPANGEGFEAYESVNEVSSGGDAVTTGTACHFIITSSDNRGLGNEFNKYDFYYSSVTERLGNNQGMTVHTFTHLPQQFNDVLPTSQLVYGQGMVGNAPPVLLERTTYAYFLEPTVAYPLLRIHAILTHNGDAAGNGNQDTYDLTTYEVRTGFVAPQSTEQISYDATGQASATLTRSDYQQQRLVRSATRTKVGWRVQRYKRLRDYVPTAAVQALQVYNFNPLVETQTWQQFLPGTDSVLVAGQLTLCEPRWRSPARSYRLRLAQPVAALNQESLVQGRYANLLSDSRYEPRANLRYATDTGDLLEERPSQGEPTAYLLGYARTLLIAEVQRATYDQIAYTSFEPLASGRWRYDSTGTHRQAGGRTGHWAYRLDGTASVTRPGLPAGDYELTYWQQGSTPLQVRVGGASVGGTATLLASTPDGWQQYRQRVHLGATAPLTLDAVGGGVSILVDELRLYPIGARMRSYTHEPLVGESSLTGPDGRTLTYEYDALGRLVRTRDEQGRILSQQQYHYAGQ